MAAHRISQDDRVSTVAHVVRTGRPSLRTTIPPEPDGGGYVSRVAQLHRRLAPGSVLVVPIRQHGNVTGAVSLCYSHSGRSYRTRDVAIAERLASGIAGVVDRIAATEVSAALDARRAGAAPGSPLRRRTAQRS
ncbi:GAF domain protein [compost metagenome]